MLRPILLICSVFMFLTSLYAEETKFMEGVSHLDFAKLLLKEANLESLLSSSTAEEDYFKVLRELGIEPSQGWDKDGIIRLEDVVYMLGFSKEEVEGLNFNELSQQLVSLLKEISSINSEESYYLPEEE
ncbi:MAG: hypothetical protein NC818_01495 [Candidatus Omnitrophica bacterium]|nr:hypothetical protein [Candidatus Omnitrophota bacterium]